MPPRPADLYRNENRYDLAGVASAAFLVTPSDANDLPVGVKSLRIENPTGARLSLRVMPENSSTPVTLGIPAGALLYEPLRVSRVYLSSPDPTGLIIHGLSD